MSEKFWSYFVYSLTLISIVSLLYVYSVRDSNLKIIACDVGQGDAILIQMQSTQVLIDAGPNDSVLDCLSKYVPFWDRSIELVVLTHPQKDHHGGLKDVFENYEVKNYLASTIHNNSSQDYKEYFEKVKQENTNSIDASAGLHFSIGDIGFKVLSPDKKMIDNFKDSDDLNIFSIVLLMRYGDFDALFTGDIDPKISDRLSRLDNVKNIEYLKIPHHGSKNGASRDLLIVSNPKIAVISNGKKNRFGHPHKEVVKMLEDLNINYLRTDQVGDIVVSTNGKSYTIYSDEK